MLELYIGLRGSGKTSYAAKISKHYQKKGIPVLSNFECDGNYLIDATDLGQSDVSKCVLIIDEAGIDFNSRKYKSLSQEFIKWIKLSRHYGVDHMVFISQSFGDIDKSIRILSDKMFIIRKCLLFGWWFSSKKAVIPYWDIDSEGQPAIKWKLTRFIRGIIFRPLYYKYFDSFACEPLPHKEFKQYHSIKGDKNGQFSLDPKSFVLKSKEKFHSSYEKIKDFTHIKKDKIKLSKRAKKYLKENHMSMEELKELDYLNKLEESLNGKL